MKDFAGTPLEVGDIVVCKGKESLILSRIRELPAQERTVPVNVLGDVREKLFLFPEYYVALYSSEYRDTTFAHVSELFVKKEV
jgi:hypothetical protein